MQRRSDLAPIPFLLCFDLVHRVDLLYTVDGRHLSTLLHGQRPILLPITTGNLDLDSRAIDSQLATGRFFRSWPWRVIFFYDSFVSAEEVERAAWHSHFGVVCSGWIGRKSSCQHGLSRYSSNHVWDGASPKRIFSFSWDGENAGLGTHLLLFPWMLVRFFLSLRGVEKSDFEGIFWGERGLPVSVLHCSFFLCVYTWACILYHGVASDNPLGGCRHETVDRVCSWGRV